jgi:hypothetical protein
MSNIDPSLNTQYVSKRDYDALKARLDTVSSSAPPTKAANGRAKKRPRPSVTIETPEEARPRSATPLVDEKGRKKRSMKLEVCP